MKKTPYKHQIGTKKANFPEPTLAHIKKKLYLCTRKTQLTAQCTCCDSNYAASERVRILPK